MAWRGPGAIDPETVRFVVDIQAVVFSALAAVPFAVFIAAGSVAMLRTSSFPAWLAWFGLLAGVINLVPLFTVSAHTGFVSPYGSLGFIGAVVFFAWIIATSVVMARGIDRESA